MGTENAARPADGFDPSAAGYEPYYPDAPAAGGPHPAERSHFDDPARQGDRAEHSPYSSAAGAPAAGHPYSPSPGVQAPGSPQAPYPAYPTAAADPFARPYAPPMVPVLTYPPGYRRPDEMNWAGITSLVLGCVSPGLSVFGAITAIAGLILGIIGILAANEGKATNRGIAIGGTAVSGTILVGGAALFAWAISLAD